MEKMIDWLKRPMSIRASIVFILFCCFVYRRVMTPPLLLLAACVLSFQVYRLYKGKKPEE